MLKRFFLILLAAGLLLCAFACAEEQTGEANSELAETAVVPWRELIAREAYEEALPQVQEAAESGDPEAMSQLAYMLVFSLGTEKDTTKGYELALQVLGSEGGEQNTLAMFLEGYHHYAGKATERNYGAAMEWFQKAAALGNGDAMACIGYLFARGYGVERNGETAFEWYRRAIENNGSIAHLYMGITYHNGMGVEKDLDAAMACYQKAWEEGNRYTRRIAAEDMAVLYIDENWAHQDAAQAEAWAEKATELGDIDVWDYLGDAVLNNTKDAGRYEKAMAYFEKGVANGSQWALCSMGSLYYSGKGVDVDYTKARELYEQAAQAGCEYGFACISMLYAYGYGVEQDGKTAIAYAEKALESEYSVTVQTAMTMIAYIYEMGIGVEQNIEIALEWTKKSAEINPSGSSYSNVGRLYYLFINDYEEAVAWFEKAAEYGDTFGLAVCYYAGKGVERDYAKAMELFLQSLNSGITSTRTGSNFAYLYIGDMYRKGQGVPQDYAAALDWYLQGSADGDPDCMLQAARLYRDGKGAEKNLDRATELYEKAGRNDSYVAYGDLGYIYQTGNGVPQDFRKAIEYYEKGAALGSAYCWGQLGYLYAYGMKKSALNYEKAREYFEKGAELGQPYSWERLGALCEEGKGMTADPEKAAEYYYTAMEKAIEQENDTMRDRSLKGLKRLGRTVNRVVINEKNVTVLVGASAELAETTLTAAVAPEKALWKEVTWSSSNEDIATVDENGVVRGVAPGKVNILATTTQPCATIKAGQVQVTVNQAVESIELDSASISVPVKKNAPVKATVHSNHAAGKKLEWSSANEAIATVNANGQISGKSVGTTTVTAKATDGSGVSAQVQVTVVQPVTKVQMREKNITLAENTSWQLHYQVLPEEATDKTLLWTSGNEAVATVDENGRITAVGIGNSNITGEAKDGSRVKAQIKVTVKACDVVLGGTQAEEKSTVLFDGAVTVSGRQMTGSFDETKVQFKNGCARIENGTLIPLKAGEDTVTVAYQADGKDKEGTFTIYVAQDAPAGE